ncbi:MAG: WbqC family protein [Proteobacteria bacterium]|nr:WbqC family protein [Pseudomonadota bacterium]
MQPTYLPWAGYFNLISKVDYFVFLDDAQFQKGSWHNRNRLLINQAAAWITVPVMRAFLGQPICDAKIDDSKAWRKQHVQTIRQNYSHHPFFASLEQIISIIEDSNIKILSDLNIRLITEICNVINLKYHFIRSSELQVEGRRSDKIKNICEKLNCAEYLSPLGAKEYLEEDQFTQLSDIKLSINSYDSVPYAQRKSAQFESYLSIVDVLANLGPKKTYDYIIGIKNQEVANVS